MRRVAVVMFALAGCFDQPSVEVDAESVELPQGAAKSVTVSVDGLAVTDLRHVVWVVDDPKVVSVTPEYDGIRLRIGAANPGKTVVHINSHGQTIDLPIVVGPPAIVYMWIEPSIVATNIGGQVHVQATGLDTMYRLQDLTLDSYWSVRDERIANLEMTGMMLRATRDGRTTLHATFGNLATITEILVLK
jgi:hypothetical protein